MAILTIVLSAALVVGVLLMDDPVNVPEWLKTSTLGRSKYRRIYGIGLVLAVAVVLFGVGYV